MLGQHSIPDVRPHFRQIVAASKLIALAENAVMAEHYAIKFSVVKAWYSIIPRGGSVHFAQAIWQLVRARRTALETVDKALQIVSTLRELESVCLQQFLSINLSKA